MEIEKDRDALAGDVVNPELERLMTENSKLKYQIVHLKRVCHVIVNCGNCGV